MSYLIFNGKIFKKAMKSFPVALFYFLLFLLKKKKKPLLTINIKDFDVPGN